MKSTNAIGRQYNKWLFYSRNTLHSISIFHSVNFFRFYSAICTFKHSNLQSVPLNIQICNLHLYIFKSAICTFTYSNLQSVPLHIQIQNLKMLVKKDFSIFTDLRIQSIESLKNMKTFQFARTKVRTGYP